MPHDIRNYIDGRFETSGNTFDDINPVDGSLVGKVHAADRDMVHRAVAAARAALSGPWGRMSGSARGIAEQSRRRYRRAL